jgi:uncharacterized protein (TIGR02118 family)
MARLVVLYKTPRDAVAFDKHYFETHVPLVKKIPGVRKYEVSKGPITTPSGPSGLHLVAIVHFDDVASIERGLATAEGQAAAADLANFASAGVDLFMLDTRDV